MKNDNHEPLGKNHEPSTRIFPIANSIKYDENLDLQEQNVSHQPHSRQKRCKFSKKFKHVLLLWYLIDHKNICKIKQHFLTVLGLFNLIQFSNARCNSTDNDKQGICYTASECRERGGNAKGTCAAGFGVCCLCKQTLFT